MTRREVLAWLEARRPVPPDALRARLSAAVSDAELAPLVPLPDQLAVLGRRVLGRVACRPDGGRELAPELLADPSRTTPAEAADVARAARAAGAAGMMIGSSFDGTQNTELVARAIRQAASGLPVALFPGSALQLTAEVDLVL